mmetsp:Transcript_8038/g.16172  ORF Transcript_8038/g.16172 Transcript_8038/m.16172 type:complete len:249 (+) Transcript_8038:4788-5534(+)
MLQRGAVVLLSGGLDSATVLAMARASGFRCHTVAFDYGQRHRHELRAAEEVAAAIGARDHRTVKVDLKNLLGPGSSSLLSGSTLQVPKGRMASQTTSSPVPPEIPNTYVPARNTLFLSFALAMSEARAISDVFIGANAVDYSGYPDCRPEFFEAFSSMARLATKVGVESGGPAFQIHAPLMHWTKKEIIQKGLSLGVDYSITHSCYDPGELGRPCEQCDACLLRASAFRQLGFGQDPVVERYGRVTAS